MIVEHYKTPLLIYYFDLVYGPEYIINYTELCYGWNRNWTYFLNSKKVNRKVQGVPQSQTAANPRHQEEENKDNKQKMHKKRIDQLSPPQAKHIGLFCYLLTLHTLYKWGLIQTRPWKGIQGYNSFIAIS